MYNALGIPLAAGLLYPFTGWLLSPMIAALAMSLSSVSVITNALRLRRFKDKSTVTDKNLVNKNIEQDQIAKNGKFQSETNAQHF